MSDSVRLTGSNSGVYNGITVNTPYEDSNTAGVKVEDFLQLMIAQLTNQDFMDPVDDTQYVTQLAQFATMQSMQELSHYSQTNYVTSLVGKSVTVASYGLGGAVNKETGLVTKVDLSGDEYTVTVNGKTFTLSQIMNIADPNTTVPQSDLDGAEKLTPYVNNVTESSIALRWDAPVSDAAQAKDLTYDVYYTTNDALDFNEINGVKRGEKAATGLLDPNYTITGLEAGKTYFINIVVTNKAGEQAIYKSTTQITKS
ncbi:MAG: hypothetical protein GXY32_02015 [Ruminococcaceae bacterium]|nr:hypothetical protein [Oscillospiraceae bacterium]